MPVRKAQEYYNSLIFEESSCLEGEGTELASSNQNIDDNETAEEKEEMVISANNVDTEGSRLGKKPNKRINTMNFLKFNKLNVLKNTVKERHSSNACTVVSGGFAS